MDNVKDHGVWLCRSCCAVNTAGQQRRELAERRDMLAAAALTGLCGAAAMIWAPENTIQDTAAQAYRLADAMLVARTGA